jgi:hypothetical protein
LILGHASARELRDELEAPSLLGSICVRIVAICPRRPATAAGRGPDEVGTRKPSVDSNRGGQCCAVGAVAPDSLRARAERNSENVDQALQPLPPVAIARQADPDQIATT